MNVADKIPDRYQLAGLSFAFILIVPVLQQFNSAFFWLYFPAFVGVLLVPFFCLHGSRAKHLDLWLVLILLNLSGLLLLSLLNSGFDFSHKALFFYMLTVVLGVLAAFGFNKKLYDTFSITYISFALFFIVLIGIGYGSGAWNYMKYWDDLGYGVDIDYLRIGALLGVAFCLAVAQAISYNISGQWGWILVSVLLLVGVVLSWSRGALLFSLLSVFFLLVFYWPAGLNRKNILTRIFIFFLALMCVFVVIPDKSMSRVLRMTDINKELNEQGRGQIWSYGVEQFKSNPLIGGGLGTSYNNPHGPYPHNHILQFAIDGGIILLLLGIFLLISPLLFFACQNRVSPSLRNDPVLWGLAAAYFFLLLEYSKSGDIYKGRDLFIIAGFLVGGISHYRNNVD